MHPRLTSRTTRTGKGTVRPRVGGSLFLLVFLPRTSIWTDGPASDHLRYCIPVLLHSCFQWTTNPRFPIIQVVSSDDDLGTLASALHAADLTETLGDGNATSAVFAPSNPAFDNVDVSRFGKPDQQPGPSSGPLGLLCRVELPRRAGRGAHRQRPGGTRERHARERHDCRRPGALSRI